MYSIAGGAKHHVMASRCMHVLLLLILTSALLQERLECPSSGVSPRFISPQQKWNPFKCHEEAWAWQPIMLPPKRFDIFPPDWGMLRRSRRVQIFLKNTYSYRTIIFPAKKASIITGNFLKKNQNAPRRSEHPPVREETCQNIQVGSKAANTKPLRGI